MPQKKIKRALISVYDKTGIVDFARALVDEFGIEIISTGGTAALLKENSIPVTLVEDVTGFPEMMDGRVKTLHPKIHAAILADRDNPEHMRQLKEQGIEPIDMVVVSLYPFEKTVADPNCTFEQAIEMIDIGGPCMLRAAAKNHRNVVVISESSQVDIVLERMRENGGLVDSETRLDLAYEAFDNTSDYDRRIHFYLSQQAAQRTQGPDFSTGDDRLRLPIGRLFSKLRYGENPHQRAAAYKTDVTSPCGGLSALGQKASGAIPISFNNLIDADAAVSLCTELTGELASCGTGFQPVRSRQQVQGVKPLIDERHTRRNLPHIQTPGKTYFVTFRLKGSGELAPAERDIVFSACEFWNGKKLDLHAAVVMPDHVHLLLTPLETATGQWVPLGEIVHSIKRHSANRINKLRGRSGVLWQDEYFDRIMRNEKEYEETWSYIANNPIKIGLDYVSEYKWFWDERRHGGEEAHRLKTGATQVDTTQVGDTQAGTRQVGDTQAGTRQAGDTQATCVFIKHTNACGVGVESDPVEAYRKAYLGDPNAAMGGILVVNFEVDATFAETVMNTYQRWGKDAGAGGFFVEVWLAPSFEDNALDVIRTRKSWGQRVRLLAVGDMNRAVDEVKMDVKKIAGGMLAQGRDIIGLNEDQWKVVTKRRPLDSEMADLRLAWLVCKHTKSNAITVCKDNMLIGNGAGQASRVMSCRIATWLAKENGHADKLAGAVAASDAFFPFRDGPDILMDAGVTAVIQPGGSKRDADTIAACDERDVAMIFTGTRHFRH